MNVEFKNLKDNEWVITNNEGKMRFVTSDTQNTEMDNILAKEDELELMQDNKKDILDGIDTLTSYIKMGKKLRRFMLGATIVGCGLGYIIFQGPIALLITSLIIISFFLGIIEIPMLFYQKNSKEQIAIYEETLQEIKEKEIELEKEIEKLKEKYNFKEEIKENNYLEDLTYNKKEKDLVRERIKH